MVRYNKIKIPTIVFFNLLIAIFLILMIMIHDLRLKIEIGFD